MSGVSASYSSTVQLRLHVAGSTFDLAQVGNDYIILRQPADVPPCDAELSVIIDGDDVRRPIRLIDGIQPFGDLAVRTERL